MTVNGVMATFSATGNRVYSNRSSMSQQRVSYSLSGGGPSTSTGKGEEALETRVAIRDVSPHQPNTVIVGIVVTKQRIHTFPDKRNPGSMRCKFTFTLRDSPSDYINATCWGSEDHVRQLHSSFKIYDVVEIQNAQISSKAMNGDTQNEKWSPWTPSQYQMNISEIYSSLSLYSGWDYTEFTALTHVPLRPPSDYHTLTDILSAHQSMKGSHVNILAVIKRVCSVREMTSKSGKPLKKCDIHLMDEGSSHFLLVMWDNEMIELAQTWTPRENVIFAVDVKVTYDTFRQSMVATCDQRTIIITNPDCREAHQLYQYAQTVEPAVFQDLVAEGKGQTYTEDGGDDIASISRVYTVEALKEEISSRGGDGSSFTGILFTYLTTLDIERGLGSVLCHRWYKLTKCGYRVSQDCSVCPNKSCTLSAPTAESSFNPDLQYSMLVSLTDATGTLDSILLAGQAASTLLAYSPMEFSSKMEQTRADIKVGLILERFKVYFKCSCSQKRNSIRILSISLADPSELATHFSS